MTGRLILLGCIFFFLSITPVKAQDEIVPVFTIEEKSDEINLNASLMYLEEGMDIDEASIAQVSDNEFQPLSDHIKLDPNKTYWIKSSILLKAESGLSINDWYLFVGECDYFEVYVYDDADQLISYHSGGSMLPESEKDLKIGNKERRVQITIEPEIIYQLFIRYSRINQQPIQPHVQLLKYDYYQSWSFVQATRRDWFFLGFIFTMIVFNMMYYVLTKVKAFLFHGLFISGVFIFTLDYFGITADLPLVNEYPILLQLVDYLALAIIDICYFQFVRNYLDLESNDPVWNTRFKWIIRLKAIFYTSIIAFHYITFNEPLADIFLAIFLVGGFLFTIVFLSFLYRNKEVRRNLVLAGTVILFLAVALNAISIIQSKGLWTLFTEIGIGLEIVLFSFALAYRMKILREEKTEAENIKELDALKNKFFTNISHEFRTPLTIINGITEMSSKKITNLDTGGLQLSFQKIKNQSGKLLNLVNQVLGLTKLETKSMNLSPRNIPIVGWMYMVVSDFEDYATQKGLEVKFSTQVEEGMVEVDDQLLKTVLTNLLSNAIKFTPQGGKIEVNLSDHQKDERKGILITVKDNGIGIRENDVSKIFDRYYQADPHRGLSPSGMGVGLSICKEIIQLMEGKIDVYSQFNDGTQFNIWLPLEILPAEINSLVPQASEEDKDFPFYTLHVAPDEKPIIMVVEDHADMSEMINEMLEEHYSTINAFNGEEGYEKAIEHIPDIVIADIMMPVMDGLELCQKLKTNERTDHIPIIILTAKADYQDRIIGYEQGADAYITKPFEKKELMVIIHNLYSMRKILQEKYSQFSFIEESISVKTDDSFIHKLHELLENHLSNADISVEDIAKNLFMSRMQLHRKIKAIAGKSASHYIRSYRLHKARLLLKDLHSSISDVAYDVGFTSPNYFSRSFHKEFGVTPTEFRSSMVL